MVYFVCEGAKIIQSNRFMHPLFRFTNDSEGKIL